MDLREMEMESDGSFSATMCTSMAAAISATMSATAMSYRRFVRSQSMAYGPTQTSLLVSSSDC